MLIFLVWLVLTHATPFSEHNCTHVKGVKSKYSVVFSVGSFITLFGGSVRVGWVFYLESPQYSAKLYQSENELRLYYVVNKEGIESDKIYESNTVFPIQISNDKILIHGRPYNLRREFKLGENISLKIYNQKTHSVWFCKSESIIMKSLLFPSRQLSKGKSYTLSCSASGAPFIDSWWLFNGSKVHSNKVTTTETINEDYYSVTTNLTVETDSCKSVGEYTCMMKHGFSNQTSSSSVALTNYLHVFGKNGEIIVIEPTKTSARIFRMESYLDAELVKVSCNTGLLSVNVVQKREICSVVEVFAVRDMETTTHFTASCNITVGSKSDKLEHGVKVEYCGDGMVMLEFSCRKCLSNQWSNKTSNYQCFNLTGNCGEGFYSSTNRCIPCPFGLLSTKNAASKSEDCYAPATRDCLAGFYGVNGSCYPCPNGTTSFEKGAVKPRDCSCLEGSYREGDACYDSRSLRTADVVQHIAFIIPVLLNILLLTIVILIIVRYRKELNRLYKIQVEKRSEFTSLPVSLPMINVTSPAQTATLTIDDGPENPYIHVKTAEDESDSTLNEFQDVDSIDESLDHKYDVAGNKEDFNEQESYSEGFEDGAYEHFEDGAYEHFNAKEAGADNGSSLPSILPEQENLYSSTKDEKSEYKSSNDDSQSTVDEVARYGDDDDELLYATIQTLPSGIKSSMCLNVKNKERVS